MTDDGVARCRWCGEAEHKNSMTGRTTGMYCPMVRAFEFNDAGQVTRVEYLTPRDCVTTRNTAPDDEAGNEYPRLGST